jgi:pantothenate synthetase
LDHYLEVLKTKPGALPGATALAQARASRAFTPSHQAYWDACRRARGDAAGTRALIEIASNELRSAGIEPEYVEARSAEDLSPVAELNGRPVLVAVAARVGRARLIDNVVIAPPTETTEA